MPNIERPASAVTFAPRANLEKPSGMPPPLIEALSLFTSFIFDSPVIETTRPAVVDAHRLLPLFMTHSPKSGRRMLRLKTCRAQEFFRPSFLFLVGLPVVFYFLATSARSARIAAPLFLHCYA
jgi:hypothetical protein